MYYNTQNYTRLICLEKIKQYTILKKPINDKIYVAT